MKWLETLDAKTREDLKKLVTSTVQHKKNYHEAGDPSTAQLWLALVEMHRRLEKLESRVHFLEDRKNELENIEEDLKKW